MARQAQSAVDIETKVALIERDMSHMVTMFWEARCIYRENSRTLWSWLFWKR